MRKAIYVLPVALSAAGVLLLALPASAAETVDTDATVAVTGGTLDVSAPAGPVALGTITASPVAQTIGGLLGDVTVTDGRGGTAGWAVTVSATPVAGLTPGSGLTYTTAAAAVTGSVSVAPAAADTNILVSSAVQTATAVSGANTAVWSPTITVELPAGALVGTYSSTITHSVA